MKIVSRWDDTILWEDEAGTVLDAVYAALKSGADLRGANLGGANLGGADLRDANLRDADLRDANLGGANLRGANLGDANLTRIRDDVWAILSGAPQEVPTLLAKLRAGEVDGSCYEGTCACLVGTLANARGVAYTDLCGIQPDSGRLAEVWFTGIHPGDTPESNEQAKIAADWIETWLSNMRVAFGPAPSTEQAVTDAAR